MCLCVQPFIHSSSGFSGVTCVRYLWLLLCCQCCVLPLFCIRIPGIAVNHIFPYCIDFVLKCRFCLCVGVASVILLVVVVVVIAAAVIVVCPTPLSCRIDLLTFVNVVVCRQCLFSFCFFSFSFAMLVLVDAGYCYYRCRGC